MREMPKEPQFPSQGATLFVDLEQRTTQRAYTPLAVTRTVLGGRGANMYYLYRLLDETLTPLDPNIPMIFGSITLAGRGSIAHRLPKYWPSPSTIGTDT